MKNILFVIGDTGACGYYRMNQPAQVLNYLSKEITCITTFGDIIPSYDYMYIQRCCNQKILDTLAKLKEQNSKLKLFIDFDDLIFGQELPEYNLCSRNIDIESNTKALMQHKDLIEKISVSTPVIKEELIKIGFPENKVMIIPNMLSLMTYHWPHRNIEHDIQIPSVLLAGSNTHYDQENKRYGDFPVDLVNYLNKKCEINVIGTKPFFIDKCNHTPFVNMFLYPLVFMNNKSDFVIAPLKNNVFNKAKSNLKYLETCAAGKVFIGTSFPGSPYENINEICRLNENGTNIDKIIKNLKNKTIYNNVVEEQYRYLNDMYIEKNFSLYEEFFKV